MLLRQSNGGVSARAHLHTPPLFLGSWLGYDDSRWMIVEFLELTFSRHDTCNLRCDTSLALARSSPTWRYTCNDCTSVNTECVMCMIFSVQMIDFALCSHAVVARISPRLAGVVCFFFMQKVVRTSLIWLTVMLRWF